MSKLSCTCGHEKRDHQIVLTGRSYGGCKICLCNAFVRPPKIAAEPVQLVAKLVAK